ncbi:MAG: glycoside hydrolase [Pirellulaceae bacterium]|nr:glycoside hydrolase [Pirellulaceae bacterium]
MATIFSLCLASCGLAIGAAADAVPAGGDYGEPRLLVASPDDAAVAHLSWPKIVTTSDGTLVLAYSAGKGHNIGGSGPAVSRSTDGGATFSRPQVLIRFPDDDARYRDCGNMALGIAGGGRVVVLLAMAYSGNTHNTILGWRSTDGGATWVRVDTSALADNKTGSVYGHILQIPDMGHVVFGHYRQPSQPASGIWMSVSRDHGMTWGPPRVVTKKAYFEPAFTFTQGRFVGLLRLPSDGQARRYDEAVSDDLGNSWQIRPSTIAIPEGQPGRQPSPFITVSPADPSKLYALQSVRDQRDESRGRVYLWTADAKQLDWQRQGVVVSIPATAGNLSDWSYPWMTPVGDGKWMLAFYAGSSRGANSIYGMIWSPQPQR